MLRGNYLFNGNISHALDELRSTNLYISNDTSLYPVLQMRVFKLAQSWKTMRVLLSIIVSTLGSLANLTAILGIIMFIFAAMGKQLFSVSFPFGAAAPKTGGSGAGKKAGAGALSRGSLRGEWDGLYIYTYIADTYT